MDAHILDARMDESVHVLMITGAGEKFFCAGADIKMLEGAIPNSSTTGRCDDDHGAMSTNERDEDA